MDELENLKEGENPAPHVENFLPAVLPALRIATRLIGRPRVVGFLAGFLGKLISNLVGPQHAPALSRAMVDAGLKLLSLEASDEQESPTRDVGGRGDGRGDLDPRRLASRSRPRQPGAAGRLRARGVRAGGCRQPAGALLGGDLQEAAGVARRRGQRDLGHASAAPPQIQALLADVQREDHAADGGGGRELRGHAACPITSRISWACRKAKTSRRRFICSRCSPAARRPTSRATKPRRPGSARPTRSRCRSCNR